VFPATLNKKGIAIKQRKKLMKHIIFPEGPTKLILPPLQETGRPSEDLNLPIDNCRKIILSYKQ